MRSIDIIPKPRSLEPNSGVFALDRSVTFDVDPSAARAVEALRVVIGDTATPVSDGGGATIRVAVHPGVAAEHTGSVCFDQTSNATS